MSEFARARGPRQFMSELSQPPTPVFGGTMRLKSRSWREQIFEVGMVLEGRNEFAIGWVLVG